MFDREHKLWIHVFLVCFSEVILTVALTTVNTSIEIENNGKFVHW